MNITRTTCIGVLGLVLTACSTTDGNRISSSVASPLHDFNIASTDIPLVLSDARKQPYMVPADVSCDSLNSEVRQLDDALGPDLDVIRPDRGAAGEVDDAAMSAIQSTMEGVVPFRGWIRRISGAERHSRDVAAAISAGTARRAFLKGIGRGLACPDMGSMLVAKSS
ncbi:MAG: hypothetical protein JO269_04645 [Burkholderiaceae bacterium]|nr:hypothetical protein [Burkholderiaceae bacterium]